jgi:hypothetical protein
MRMPSSAARRDVAPDDRPLSNPTGRPSRCSHLIAAPSRMKKALLSSPPEPTLTVPSVKTPSTSSNSSRRRRIRASIWSAGSVI